MFRKNGIIGYSDVFVAVLFLLIVCVSGNKSIIDNTQKEPIVCISNGCLQGVLTPGYQTDTFQSFLGIPYAQPPLGKLRFANPVPAENWTGILDATKPKSECAQKNYLIPNPPVTGSEDCLYLNVYRPSEDYDVKKKPYPVMVFIHGGAFFAGGINPAVVGAHYFMDTSEVILVAMAYRLGALGFLSTGDLSSPGNFGLKDQTLALKWVQKNIEQFGGDPNSVTLFGVSAGAASTHMHMLSPLSKNLFNRAIVMSGSAIGNYNEPHKRPLSQARKQASLVGIKNTKSMPTKDLVRELRNVDAEKLIDSGDGLRFWSVDPLTEYRPVIEPDAPGAFLTEDPAITLKEGNYQAVPWMTGLVQNEGAVRAAAIVSNKTLLAEFNTKFDWLLPRMVTFNVKSPKKNEVIVERLKEFYLNNTNEINEENSQSFIDIMSDSAFYYPFYKTVENYLQHADTDKNPIYLYRFIFKGPISYSAAYTQTLTDFGTVHLDDTLYLFHSALFPEFPKNSTYAEVIRTLVDTYVEFAKNGKPKIWSPISPCKLQHEGDICDYQEFRNSKEQPDTLEIQTENKFNLKMVKLWEELS